jgi:hypothetical protein
LIPFRVVIHTCWCDGSFGFGHDEAPLVQTISG